MQRFRESQAGYQVGLQRAPQLCQTGDPEIDEKGRVRIHKLRIEAMDDLVLKKMNKSLTTKQIIRGLKRHWRQDQSGIQHYLRKSGRQQGNAIKGLNS